MTQNIEQELEAHINGLHFTEPFNGHVPVQAFGSLGRKHFYFRYRGHHASLLVGDLPDPGEARKAEEEALTALLRNLMPEEEARDAAQRELADAPATRIPESETVADLYTPEDEAGGERLAEIFTQLVRQVQSAT